jgi:bifunctional UDP-N-acetylglucosamine pyrophosphorylase / glucosamine-1-phosphate N-acetyltransferase
VCKQLINSTVALLYQSSAICNGYLCGFVDNGKTVILETKDNFLVLYHHIMAHIIILAGGKGTRMKSELPKVLHEIKGTPIILRQLENMSSLCPEPTIIVGFKADEVRQATGNRYHYVEQKEQLGTGHAIMCAKENLKDKDFQTIIVLPGDHPLVKAETFEKLLNLHNQQKAVVTIGTYVVPHYEEQYSMFMNFGRVIRGEDGTVSKIVEFKDATDEERACKEVNLSYYCFDAQWLWNNIDKISNNNKAGEYYLTDLVQIAKDQGLIVAAYPIQDINECLGINSPEQLAMVEAALA